MQEEGIAVQPADDRVEPQEKSIPVRHLPLWANVEPLDLLGEAHVLRGTSWPDLGGAQPEGRLSVRPGA